MVFIDKITKIKAFAFDIDGVLSSGVVVMPDGDLLRIMNIRDGYAIRKCMDAGYQVAIISTGNTSALQKRFENLKVKYVYLNSKNKLEDLKDYALKINVDLSQIAYMGDDLPDLKCIKAVGMGCCPNNASDEIKAFSDYISRFNGGECCVRDVIETVLRAKGDWTIETD